MPRALVLIDLQEDFLRADGLEPCRDAIVDEAAALLAAWRRGREPIVHVWTTVRGDADRMPHWREQDRRLCVEGTEGHRCPPPLTPAVGETVVHKTFFSAFSVPAFAAALQESGADTLVLCGVHLHGCVRATALDAYQRGFRVLVADEAVGGYDPVHAECTRRFLDDRGMRFVPTATLTATTPAPPALVPRAPVLVPRAPALVHHSPSRKDEILFDIPRTSPAEIERAADAAALAQAQWSLVPAAERAALVYALADRLDARREDMARMIALHVGKPIRDARGEVAFGIDLVRVAAESVRAPRAEPHGEDWRLARRPVGVVATITPFNNPFAVPLGKLAPALAHGNAVVWKPAPAGTEIARAIVAELRTVGFPPDVAAMMSGDHEAARAVMAARAIGAVTLTGSVRAGTAAAIVCARRHLPLQAELGGNNAAIVWRDADLALAAREIALGAFGSAGQRCTANRRVVVDRHCLSEFVALLERETAALVSGPPLDEATQVGPLVSADAARRVAAALRRARDSGIEVRVPAADGTRERELAAAGWYQPPAIACSDDPRTEIVQEETFGPVLVVQPATDWEHALRLLNGVRHGLVAALFASTPEHQRRFLAGARAGILKINRATAGAAPDAPFGGWGCSAIGLPEHGSYDVEFYTRPQAVYGP